VDYSPYRDKKVVGGFVRFDAQKKEEKVAFIINGFIN
jgi:hypothetical protein